MTFSRRNFLRKLVVSIGGLVGIFALPRYRNVLPASRMEEQLDSPPSPTWNTPQWRPAVTQEQALAWLDAHGIPHDLTN